MTSHRLDKIMMQGFFVAVLLFTSSVNGFGQLTEHTVSKEKWTLYGQVKTIGVARASLEYKANANDSSFIFIFEDERKELKKFFSIPFNSRGNTLNNLYYLLISFFEKENWKNEDYIKIFTLGDTKVTVYKAAGLIQAKTIMLSTDKGRIKLTKNEISRLFNK